MTKGTPASSQIIWLEDRVKALEAELAGIKIDLHFSRMATHQAEEELTALKAQEPIHQWRGKGCEWHDGHPDNDDGGGPYETRTLYASPAPVVKQEPTTILAVCEACDGSCNDRTDSNYGCSVCGATGRVEKRVYLTSPVPVVKQEPVGEVGIVPLMDKSVGFLKTSLPIGTKLYADPVPSDNAALQLNELLFAVESKFPGETRFQTALRYVREAESREDSGTPSEAKAAELPVKKVLPDRYSNYEYGFCLGWNACIDAMKGEG